MRNARAIAFFGGLLLLAVIVIIWASTKPTDPEPEDGLSVLNKLEPTTKQTETLADEQAVQFLRDKTGVPVSVIVGEAGVYPPRKIKSDAVGHVSVDDLTPERDGAIEVLVRAVNAPFALWREWNEVPTPGSTVPLISAQSIPVEVRDADGGLAIDAHVRLGRDEVSLIWVDATTNEDGIATFETIPPGSYVIQAAWKGRSGHTVVTQKKNAPVETALIQLQTAPDKIDGTVKNTDGEGIANATIVIFDGEGDLPLDIVETNMFGQFEAEPSLVPSKMLVRHTKYATKQVSLTGTLPSYDVVLERGKTVKVVVSTPSKRNVTNALVTWTDQGFVGEAKTTDKHGEALFESVPTGATFIARKANAASSTVKPKLTEGANEIRLFLANLETVTRPFRFRVRDPKNVLIESISAEAGELVCDVEFLAGSDWQISGCPEEATAMFSIVTSHGVVSRDAQLIDGFELELPTPADYVVDIKADGKQPWGRTTLKYTDSSGKTSLAQLDLLDDQTARWNAKLYPGRYGLDVEVLWKRDKLTIPVTLAEEKSVTVTLSQPDRYSVWVVDRQSAPVTNAYLMVWVDGKLHDVGLSSGQLPNEFTVPKGTTASIIAIDPRRGEGTIKLGEVERIQLNDDVGAGDVPPTRVSKEKIAERLGVSFVSRDNGFMFDVPVKSHADELGLQSEDLYVTAFEKEEQTFLIIQRDGRYSELSFASNLPASNK